VAAFTIPVIVNMHGVPHAENEPGMILLPGESPPSEANPDQHPPPTAGIATNPAELTLNMLHVTPVEPPEPVVLEPPEPVVPPLDTTEPPEPVLPPFAPPEPVVPPLETTEPPEPVVPPLDEPPEPVLPPLLALPPDPVLPPELEPPLPEPLSPPDPVLPETVSPLAQE
jgi:hypothetical protein